LPRRIIGFFMAVPSTIMGRVPAATTEDSTAKESPTYDALFATMEESRQKDRDDDDEEEEEEAS
jgi:hypothetical protein